jgi:hypothetical protein
VAQTWGGGLQTPQGGGVCTGFLLGPGPVEVKRTRIVFSTRDGSRFYNRSISITVVFVLSPNGGSQVGVLPEDKGPCAGGTMTYPEDGCLRNYTDRVVVRDFSVVGSQQPIEAEGTLSETLRLGSGPVDYLTELPKQRTISGSIGGEPCIYSRTRNLTKEGLCLS